MRKTIVFVLAIIVLCPGVVWGISADLGEVGVGARPLGMGKGYVGLADDTSSIFLNPAGISKDPGLSFLSMTGKLLQDVNYVSVGVCTPVFTAGDFGIGYINASTTGIPLTTLTRTGTQDVINQYGITDYSSSVLYFTLSRDILKNLSAGASLKLFNQGFSQASGSLEGASGTGWDMDFGMRWQYSTALSMGVVLQNGLPASLGGKFNWVRNNVEEGIPAVLKTGVGIKVLGEEGFYQFREQELFLTLDNDMLVTQKRPGVWHLGSEWWLTSWVALRGGIDQKARATEAGVGVDNNMTAGVGLKYQGFTFDYAYHQFGELTENTTHFFSFGYEGEMKKSKIAEMLEVEQKKLLVPKVKKTTLKSFKDVDEDYWAREPIEYLATLKIISGYPDDTFKPDEPLTRAELAALLVRAKGFKVEKQKTAIFKDMPPDHWAAPYVAVALQRKYITGYPDGKFMGWKKVTRAEAIVVLAKFAGLNIPIALSSNPYPDVEKRHWAARAIFAAKHAGLLEYISGDLKPKQLFTRAEAAEVISKTPFAKEKIKELLKK